jgi:hypothetical protein
LSAPTPTVAVQDIIEGEMWHTNMVPEKQGIKKGDQKIEKS